MNNAQDLRAELLHFLEPIDGDYLLCPRESIWLEWKCMDGEGEETDSFHEVAQTLNVLVSEGVVVERTCPHAGTEYFGLTEYTEPNEGAYEREASRVK